MNRFIPFLTFIFLQLFFFSSAQQKNSSLNSIEAFTESNLPIVIVNTNGQSIVDNPKIIVSIGIIYNGPGLINHITDPPNEYSGKAGIEYRGSHSQTYPKKSYSFETMDNSGTEKSDVSIFGMPEEHDWILNASYADKSLSRDVLTYQLSNEMGHYAARTKYVELVVNGSYQGVFIFSESIKRKSGRLNIANLHPWEIDKPEVTGGYIMKLDKHTGNGGGGWTSQYPPPVNVIGQTIYFQYDYPSSDSIVPSQEAYIQAYVDSFEDALKGPNFKDTLHGYPHYIGKGSWIDYFLLTELSKNLDGYRISAYLYKDKDKTLKAGPVWDYDVAWGNANHCDAYDTTGWAYNFPCFGDGFQVPFWWTKLLQDTNYTNEMKCRWKNYRQNVLSEQHVISILDSIENLLDEAQTRNFNKWPILGTYVWPNNAPFPSTYDGEIQNLKNWVHTRLQWLDDNVPGHCSCSVSVNFDNVSCNNLCDGKAFASGSSPYPKTYEWSNGNDSTLITDLCAGNYSLTIKNSIGCTKTTNFTISQPQSLTANVSTTNSTCNGNGCDGSAIINASGGNVPYTILWSDGQTGSHASFFCKGNYSVTVTDDNGCTASFPFSIQNPFAPTVSLAYVKGATCYGGSDGMAKVNVTGGTSPYTYSWFPFGGDSATGIGLMTGNYTVTVVDATGCSSQLGVNISQPPPMVIHPTVQNSSCNGATGLVSISVSGGATPYSYLWNPGGSTSPVLNNLPAGNYSVVITDDGGCTKTATYTITQPPPFVFTPVVTSPTCFGGHDGSASISATGGTGAHYFYWSPVSVQSTSINNQPAGDYLVTVTDDANCTATVTVTITDPPKMILSTTSNPATCGSSDGMASVIVTNGTSPFTYNWFPSGSTNPVATNLNAGNYVVTVHDVNGCIAKDTVNVESESGMNISSIGQTYESCHGSNDAFVNLLVSGGQTPYTYLWLPGGGTNSFESDLTPGNYSVTITDDNNCQVIYQLQITEPLPLTINLQSTQVSCNGLHNGTLLANVLGGSAPYNYLWQPGSSVTGSINNLAAGNYSVRVTDDHGCTITSSTLISEPSPLLLSVTTYESHCGKSNGSAVAHASGGTRNYVYEWSFGGSDSVAENLHSGNYFVKVTDENDCVVTDSFTLKDNSPSSITVSAINPVTCNGGHDGSVVLHASCDGDVASYSWTPNVSSGLVANNLSSGVYSVIIRDGNRCRDSIGFIVPQPAPLASLVFTENNKCFGGSEGTLYADAGGGTQPYSYLWSNGQQNDSAVNLPAGNYSLVITDAHGCTSTSLGTITQPDSIHISFDIVNATCTTCVNGSIEAMISGGLPPYSLNWKTINKDTAIISDLGAGTYTLCVTDGNNCVHCDSAMVNGGNIGIEEISNSNGLHVYPNPVEKNGVFAFALNKKQKVTIKLFSTSGQLVKTIVDDDLDAGQRAIRFDVSALSPGVYYFQFLTRRGLRRERWLSGNSF